MPATKRPPATPTADARTVRVRAHLQTGAVIPTQFPAPLDGILATAERQQRGVKLSDIDHHHPRLPLCQWRHGTNKQWVWAATCALNTTNAPTDVRWWHKRHHAPTAERVVPNLPANTDVGITKAWRMPAVATITAHLEWICLGDPDAIRDLLTRIRQIGKKRSQGDGLVLSWEITDEGPADWTRLWWTPDGTISRPLPARAAHTLGLPTETDTIQHTIRPPYWRPPQTETNRGGFARAMRTVIAPWVTKPQP